MITGNGEEQTMTMTRAKLLLILVLGILLPASCGSDGEALEHIAHRADSGSRVRPYSSLIELRDLVIERKESGVGNESVVVGTITEVSRGGSFSWDVNDTTDTVVKTQYPFGDDRAMVHTIHLTVDVSEVIAPPSKKNIGTITVGLAVDSEIGFDSVENDYSDLGTVVLFLTQSAVFDYEPGIYGIFEGGALMGVLKNDGTLRFPTLLEPEVLLGGNRTIALDTLRIGDVDG